MQPMMQPINMIMIYYWDKKFKKRLHVLEDEVTIIEKNNNIDLLSLAERMHFFIGRVPNDRHCAFLSNKSLSY